ncbi:MFS transporter [Eleftheria terrae]|uniref:MFS transporter n=1 Tax=Eleftheria terrae TaxID=1597781 RepID=UPI00263B7FD4|nr:MFS transporter [Eleftheria terrae]WKB55300.1 MFS transporter [Eleftheria terrae]
MSSTSLASLLLDPHFRRLWVASVASGLAFSVAALVEQWYVVKELRLEASLGLVMMAGSLPRVLLMAVGGVVADRHSRFAIMCNSFVARGLVTLAAAGLVAAGGFTLPFVVLFALVYGAIDAFFWPARDAALPDIVEAAQLGRANSVMLITNQLALVLGPMAGGLLIAHLPYQAVFLLVSIGLVLAAAPLWATRRTAAAVPPSAHEPLARALRDGVAYVLATPVLRNVMGVQLITNLMFAGPMMVGLPLVVANRLHADALAFSSAQSALAAGMVLGGLWLAWRPQRRRRLAAMVAYIAVTGVLVALLPHAGQLQWLVALMALIGLCIAGNNVAMVALIQENTHKDKIGRVMSLNTIGWMGLAPVSVGLASGLLSLGVDVALIMTTGGLGITLACAACACGSKVVRQAR